MFFHPGSLSLTTSVRMTGLLGISYCSRNSATLSPLRRSTLSTSSQDGSMAQVAQLQKGWAWGVQTQAGQGRGVLEEHPPGFWPQSL